MSPAQVNLMQKEKRAMRSNLQRRIQRYGWDKAVISYEDGWKESLALVQSELLKTANARSGETVLDLACGTGLVSFPLADAIGPSGRLVATDISDKMIEELDCIAHATRVTNIEAVRADGETFDMFEDQSFDLVTCALGLMYFPEPMNTFEQTLRVLKPGGRAVFAVWGARKNCGWADIFPIVDARVKSEVCPMFFRMGTGSVLANELEQAGFDDISAQRISTSLPFANDENALTAAFVGGPVALAYDRFDEATRESAHAEYLASIAQYKGADGYEVPGEFVICSARAPE